MNGNEKNLNVDIDTKNRKVPVSTKQSTRRSCGVSKIENVPQVHDSRRKVHVDRRCTEQLNKPASKTVRNRSSWSKEEREDRKGSVLNEKSKTPAFRKQQSALKTCKDTVVNETLDKTNRNKSLPRSKELPCGTILSVAEHITRREFKDKDYNNGREASSQSAWKKSEKDNKSQGNRCERKCSQKINGEDKIKLNSKRTKISTRDSKTIKDIKKINPQELIEAKNTLCKNIVGVNNDINVNVEENGAARTRIFNHKKSLQVYNSLIDGKDDIHVRAVKSSQNECGVVDPRLTAKRNKDEQENKTSVLTEHNCEENSNDASCNIKDDKVISLYHGSLATPESSSDYNQQQGFGETFIKLVKERANNHFSSATSCGTNYKATLSKNTNINLCQANVLREGTKICWNNNKLKKDEKEFITDSIKSSDCEDEKIKKSLTITKIPSVSQDEITYHTNLMNYGYHSDQQYCKRFNKQQNIKHTFDAADKLTWVDKNQSTLNDNAKYNLIKALVQPTIEIHDFKGVDNNIGKPLISGYRSESVLTRRDGGLQNCCTNSLTNGSINEEISSPSNSIKQSQDNSKNLGSSETCDPNTTAIHLEQSPSTSSDYIAMNLKMKGSKHTKKYRHFKYEEKNTCCNMARYIKRMVSNERRYQEFEKNGNLEREEVKIIIDEYSPKTSKIRIVNDRSSVSVVCHSLERAISPCGRANNIAATNTESSGGESSGYKSFHNNSHTKDFDPSDSIDISSKGQNEIEHSAVIEAHNLGSIQVQHYNPSSHCETSTEPFCHKSDKNSSQNTANPLVGGLEIQQNLYENVDKKPITTIQYTSYDTNNYLSMFTNHMDMYLPCKITAYQFEEKNRSQVVQFNKELEEKDVDEAELHLRKYLTNNNSDTKDELSEEDESSEDLSSVKDSTDLEDGVIMLKAPNNLEYKSLELIVKERLLEPNNPGILSESIDIPAVPAQYKIFTSELLDLTPEEETESSEISMKASHVKFMTKNYASAGDVKSDHEITSNRSNPIFQPHVTTKKTYKRSESCGTTCLGISKHENKRVKDSNAVQELWSKKKSNVDSTDNDSQASEKSHYGESNSKKHDTDKFKCSIFRKLKSSTSKKRINIRLDQLPKPPPSFLESSESYIAVEPHTCGTPILGTNSLTKPGTDSVPIHYARKTHTDTISDEKVNHSRFRTNIPTLSKHEDDEKHQESSVAPLLNTRFFQRSEELLSPVPPSASAVPPPASALPPPYPFCCPLVPYMMQYWQNDQQPPPASTVPFPEADWKRNISMVGSEPPPPGMVPIPWFPPMMRMNNSRQSDEIDYKISNNLRAQPPPEWSMTPRGYAPCLPCSKAPELHLQRTTSFIYDDDEPAPETSEYKQDGKKKKISNKLFKIFRRKNRADIVSLDEDEKKARYHRSRSEAKSDNIQLVQNDQRYSDGHSIWDSPDIVGIVTPEEIGRCFRRGFRADGLTLSGDDYLCARVPSDTTSEQQDIFNFSDHDTPLDFLLALGFSVDEATAAIKDDDVRNRFKAALTEARIWVPHIATTQGTLLYLLAMKSKPKVMRYFLQLVESIVNKRITNAVKLDAYLKILEKVEEGYVSFVTLFGKDTGKDDEEDTVIVEKQRRRIFYTIYKYAEFEAKEVNQPLTKASVDLLHSLAARYRSAIGPHLRLLACYIGEGLLTKDVQLEAALIYLSRLDSADVQLADLEKYCGLPTSKRRRVEKIANTQP